LTDLLVTYKIGNGGPMSYSQIILAIAKKVGISGHLLLAICTHETGLQNVVVPNDHGTPTYGLCQIKSGTARDLGYEGKDEGLMDPQTNIKYAAIYLKKQLNRYHGNIHKAIAAYNAGSFVESSLYPGVPRNLHYLNQVLELLAKN